MQMMMMTMIMRIDELMITAAILESNHGPEGSTVVRTSTYGTLSKSKWN